MRFLLPVLLLACTAESEDTDAAPAPVDPAFTIVVLPDTQYLSLDPDNGVLDRMMDQILDLAEEEHVAMVLQEGDLTHDNTEAEWIAMDETFARLDGQVPYAVCVGNHDWDTDANRDTTRFNQYFGLARWEQTETFYASASETSADDHAHVFEAGGLSWMVVSLAYDPQESALAWAEQLIAEHSDHRVIVLTHAYLGPSGTVASQGVDIQARLVDPHPNVEMVLNGHFTGGTNARARRERVDGSEVLEVFANYQTLPTSGFGRMRQMRLNTEEGTLDVTSCNAYAVCSDEDGDAFFETAVDWAD